MRRIVPILLVLALPYVDAGYYSNRYSNKYVYDQNLAIDVCKESVVVVTYMTILCDSPYTFYYGNGANRNSPVCDYGDKASLSVTIKVLDDLQEEDTDIYFTMAAFDDDGNLLTSTTPENLCRDYIGQGCTKAGIYTFDKKLKFVTPPYGNQTKFYPVIHMAFSTKSDSGYNLGAVNMECQEWDQNQPAYVTWSDKSSRAATRDFTNKYGMLFGTCVMLALISSFVWMRSHDNVGFDDFPPYISDESREMSLMDL
jgi:hypothetical protein